MTSIRQLIEGERNQQGFMHAYMSLTGNELERLSIVKE